MRRLSTVLLLLVEKVVEMQQPGDYTIDVDGEPENVFIRMAVPSRPN